MSIQEFTKDLSRLDPSKSSSEKFWDFCELAFCAYAKVTAAPDRAENLEKRYMDIVQTYRDKDTIRAYPRLMAMAWRGVMDGQDFLGQAAAELNALDAKTGQFFTPMPVSQMMAMIGLQGAEAAIEEKGYITLNEPASGAGGMILAAAKVIKEMGYDPSSHLLVSAQDISQIAYHMCFLQLTFAGIPARVERCNSLSMESFDASWTPATLAFYRQHGRFF